MSSARLIRRTGALAVAAMVATVSVPSMSPGVTLSAASTALVLCGTTCPTPDDAYIEIVKNQYIAPTHPGADIDYVPVTTPEEFWPITGLFRLLGLTLGDPRLFAPGGPAWPDEPLWKLSGLFDLTADQSLRAGVADLEAVMADPQYANDPLVIYGLSQGAGVANEEKRRLAARYPQGTSSPDIEFVLSGDPNLPNGGLVSRFPGLYIPILDLTFNGAAVTDSQFHTVEINRQYDGFSDFPLYPLNVVADLNAVLGILYLHTNFFDVSLADDAQTATAIKDTHGDTDYYLFQTPDLPLFAPLRALGVPEPLIDVVEPFVRVIVDLGYDRTIPQWEPTPARLIPPLDPAKVTADLLNAVGEGVNNALALVGVPPLLNVPKPNAPAAPVPSKDIPTQTTPTTPTTAATGGRQRSTERAASTTVTGTDPPRPVRTAADTEHRTNVTTREPSANASTPKREQPVQHRPAVRDSAGVDRQSHEPSHRRRGDRPTTRNAGGDSEPRSSTASSSAASSSSSVGASSADGSD
jgi:hypothetical protein